jgi:hypothetical protein
MKNMHVNVTTAIPFQERCHAEQQQYKKKDKTIYNKMSNNKMHLNNK